MLGKIVRFVILVPLGIIIVLFAVANRQPVTVSFDPFSVSNPAYVTTLPLFVLIFILAIVGVVVGGVAAWLRQSRWRRQARRLEAENRALHSELYELKRYYVANERAPAPASGAPGPLPMPGRSETPPLALRAPVG